MSEPSEIIFTSLNRKQEIGANCYLLNLGGTQIVLDVGIHPKEEGINSTPDLDALEHDTLDGIVITHSHLDHVGALPVLMRKQPSAPVFMTPATAALSDAMLHNSVNVMSSKREELGITEYPFFTHREIERRRGSLEKREIGKVFPVGDSDVTCEFFDAGHIMGSVGSMIEYKGKRIFYTGDVNFEDQTLAKRADFPEDPVDTLILETTRGAFDRAKDFSREAERNRLAQHIAKCLDRGGSVLIPVFAMGKTQEVLLMLNEMKREQIIPRVPVFMGGLSTKMTLIFDKFADKVRRNFPGFKIMEEMDLQVSSRKHQKEIQYHNGCIYALSSGMMTEKTVSNRFARDILEDEKNALLFVGYADPDSPAGKIRAANKGDMIELDEGEVPPAKLLCDVDVFDFSGHAIREDLRAYANKLNPKNIILIHGDANATEWFQEKLSEDMPDAQIIIPKPGVPISL